MPSALDLSRKNWTRCPKVVLHVPGGDTRDENISAVAEYQYNLYLYPWFLLLKAWDEAQHKAQRWQSTKRAWGSDHQKAVWASADMACVLKPLVCHPNPWYTVGFGQCPSQAGSYVCSGSDSQFQYLPRRYNVWVNLLALRWKCTRTPVLMQ